MNGEMFDEAMRVLSYWNFSCTTLSCAGATRRQVHKYRRMFGFGLNTRHETDPFALAIWEHVGNAEEQEAQDFRVLLLSLAKVAWKDFK